MKAHHRETILYLSRADVAAALPSTLEQLELAQSVLRAVADGAVEMPPKPGVHPRLDSFMHAMPAYLRNDDLLGLKWVAAYAGNRKRGLPSVTGNIILSDAETGQTVALMDAGEITAARTAAASGVCVQLWDPQRVRTVALLGCGEQATYHVQMLRALVPEVNFRAYDRHPERARALVGPDGVVESPRVACEDAAVVVAGLSIADAPTPVIANDALADECLILPLDFDSTIDASVPASSEAFLVDDIRQFDYYRNLGRFRNWPNPSRCVGAFGTRLADLAKVTCLNTGLAALDVAFANIAVTRAQQDGLGVSLQR